MNKITLSRLKDFFINVALIFTIMIGIESILIGYNHQLNFLTKISKYSGIINPKMLHFHRALSILIGFAIIFISYRLYKRMRIAWIISISMISALTFMQLLGGHSRFQITIIVKLAVIVILAMEYKKFKRASDPISMRNGIVLSLLVAAIVVFNIGFTVYALRIKTSNVHDMYRAISDTLKMLFLMEPSVLGHLSKGKLIFAKSEIVINWVGIIAAMIFVLKPLVYQPIATMIDRERVRKLLKEYADNPISYVSVENDKKYYFGKDVDGVIVYVVAAGVAVCAGDPVCSAEDMPVLLTEFRIYCKQNDLDICFCQTMGEHIPLYTQLGFGNTKYGEEAMFKLEDYNLAGKKGAKIRNAVNHATALGFTVLEYEPLKYRDKMIEQQINDISKEWLTNKKSSELSFMLGGISLENPMDRRYFTAFDNENKMLGFIVFSPFSGGKGYMADVTRRRGNAPIGVMEKITIEAFNKMKSEGVIWGSLGLAPLANVADEGGVAATLLEFVYEKLNSFYGFKSLHHYKRKYSPTDWQPRYLVYYPKMFTPKIAYSIIKAQNPKGVTDYILNLLKNIITAKKENEILENNQK